MDSINKIIKRYGLDGAAKKLGITPRWMRYLKNGERFAGYHLQKEIDRLANRIKQV